MQIEIFLKLSKFLFDFLQLYTFNHVTFLMYVVSIWSDFPVCESLQNTNDIKYTNSKISSNNEYKTLDIWNNKNNELPSI